MVVVDVLERRTRDVHQRLGHFVEVVDHLYVVVGRVDIAALEFLEGGEQRVFALARLVEEVVRLFDHVAQHLAVLLEDGDQRAVVDLCRRLHRTAYFVAQVDDDVFRALGFHPGCGWGGGCLAFLEEIAVDEHVAAEYRDDNEGHRAAIDQGKSDDEGDQESAQRRDEPPGDDGHDARDAVHGAFAAPCAVCERRTHGYHEADIGGRKGEFERGGYGDQHGRGREVDRSAYHVVGGAAMFDVLVFETV